MHQRKQGPPTQTRVITLLDWILIENPRLGHGQCEMIRSIIVLKNLWITAIVKKGSYSA